MLKGTYVFKQNGIEIGRQENLITTNGKEIILQYLANPANDWASAISVGALSTTPSVSDTNLYYESSRTGVTLRSYRTGTPNIIIVKGTIPASAIANIYEVGVYPGLTSQVFGTRDQFVIDDFTNINSWNITSGGTTSGIISNPSKYIAYAAASPYSPRLGLYSVSLASGDSIVNNTYSMDLSSYSVLDTIDLLVNVPASSSGTLTLTLTDAAHNTSVLNYSFNGSTASGYQVLSTNFPTSILSMSTVKSMSIASTGTITIDAARVSVSSELSPDMSLVSRAVLSTPIAKLQNIPLDVEYYVELS